MDELVGNRVPNLRLTPVPNSLSHRNPNCTVVESGGTHCQSTSPLQDTTSRPGFRPASIERCHLRPPTSPRDR